MQAPLTQVLMPLHLFPSSLQTTPSFQGGFVHTPVPVLQIPAVWQLSKAEQTTRFEPVQAPAWQVSVCVQALPSLQLVLSLTWFG